MPTSYHCLFVVSIAQMRINSPPPTLTYAEVKVGALGEEKNVPTDCTKRRDYALVFLVSRNVA